MTKTSAMRHPQVLGRSSKPAFAAPRAWEAAPEWRMSDIVCDTSDKRPGAKQISLISSACSCPGQVQQAMTDCLHPTGDVSAQPLPAMMSCKLLPSNQVLDCRGLLRNVSVSIHLPSTGGVNSPIQALAHQAFCLQISSMTVMLGRIETGPHQQ